MLGMVLLLLLVLMIVLVGMVLMLVLVGMVMVGVFGFVVFGTVRVVFICL